MVFMTTNNTRNMWVSIFAVLLVSVMVACSPGSPTVEEMPSATTDVTEELPATDAPEVATATPDVPTVIFAYDSEADSFAVSQIQAALEHLLTDSPMMLMIRDNLILEMLTPNVEVVVGVGPTLNLGELARSAPAIQFVAVNDPAAQPADNLWVVGNLRDDQQRQAFMAGYLAALVSEDSKIAALVPSETEDSNLILDAFINGARFYCGICRPLYPPYNSFPQWETLAVENAKTGFGTVVDNLVAKGVEIVYVPGVLATQELLSYMAELNINVVSDTSPDVRRNNWVATVKADPGLALMELWPDLLAGSELKQISSQIILDDTGSGLLTEGRHRIFEEMAADLQAGIISPGEAP